MLCKDLLTPTSIFMEVGVTYLDLILAPCTQCICFAWHLYQDICLKSVHSLKIPMFWNVKLDQGPKGYLPRKTLVGERLKGQQHGLSDHPQHCLETRDESAFSILKPGCYHKLILQFKCSPNQPFIKCFQALNSLFNVLVTTSKKYLCPIILKYFTIKDNDYDYDLHKQRPLLGLCW